MVDYYMLNKITPYIPYAMMVIGPGAIFFTAWYMSRKNCKDTDNLIDNLRKRFEPEWKKGNKIAGDIGREADGLHESVEGLSRVINSIKQSKNELKDLLSKIR